MRGMEGGSSLVIAMGGGGGGAADERGCDALGSTIKGGAAAGWCTRSRGGGAGAGPTMTCGRGAAGAGRTMAGAAGGCCPGCSTAQTIIDGSIVGACGGTSSSSMTGSPYGPGEPMYSCTQRPTHSSDGNSPLSLSLSSSSMSSTGGSVAGRNALRRKMNSATVIGAMITCGSTGPRTSWYVVQLPRVSHCVG